MTNMEKARQLAAQAWCDPETSGKEMDPVLAEAFAKRLAILIEALDEACDIIAWMSGSNDFSSEGKASEGWERAKRRFHALRDLARDPACNEQVHPPEASSPSTDAEK